MATIATPVPLGARLGALADRQFKYLMIGPAVLVLLLIGLFPIIYTLVVSFQNITMMDEDTLVQRPDQLRPAVSRPQALAGPAAHLCAYRDRPAAGAGAGHGAGAPVPRAHARAAGVRRAAGPADRDLADHRRRHCGDSCSTTTSGRSTRSWAGSRASRCRCSGHQPGAGLSGDRDLPRSGSGRRSCSCCCSRHSRNVDQSLIEAAEIDGAGWWRIFLRIVLPAIRPVLAIALLIRGARSVPPVRHRLGADQGRARHDDRDDLDLRLRPGLPAVRDQLHGRDGVRWSSLLRVALRRDAGAAARGDRPVRPPPSRRIAAGPALSRPRSRSRSVFLFPIYWLFIDLVQDAGGDLRLPAGLVAAASSSSTTTRCCSRTATPSRSATAWSSPASAPCSRCCSARCAPTPSPASAPAATTSPMWVIRNRMVPPIAIVFPIFLLYVRLGWVDTYHRPDRALHRLQPALRDLDDARLHPGHPARARGDPRWSTAARAGSVFWKVVLPMARAGLFATAVFTFVFAWNEFLFALVLTRSDGHDLPGPGDPLFRRPVQLLVQDRRHERARHGADLRRRGGLQRYLVRGISLGAVKG